MDYQMSGLIDFYSMNEAAIRITDGSSPEHPFGHEAIFLGTFLFRQMHNLQGTGLDQIIAHTINQMTREEIFDFNLFDNIGYPDSVNRTLIISPYRGNGNKCFQGYLKVLVPSSGPTFGLVLKIKGFGLFGKEVNFYAIQSLNLLIRYFVTKNKTDPDYVYHLHLLLVACGREYSRGNVGAGLSQGDAVKRIMDELYGR